MARPRVRARQRADVDELKVALRAEGLHSVVKVVHLKGAEILLRRHKPVLVNDTAETITAQNADIMAWRRRRNRPSWLRWRERQRAMGPVTVVVIVERHNDPLKVLLVQNQQAVETFAAGRRCQPISVAGLTMKDRQCARGSNRLAAARNRRSTAVVRGRRVVRRRMASSCRRTMI